MKGKVRQTMEIKDYMKLPYTKLVQEMNDESGHYFYGRILKLDGCQRRNVLDGTLRNQGNKGIPQFSN